jgi:uncharacterized protein YbjT (DUF2867 family)/DNA-binding CsgD family transcriptional regulator
VLQITPTERHALRLLAQGKAASDLSLALKLSRSVLESHLNTLFVRMGVSNTADAVKDAERRGLLITRRSNEEEDEMTKTLVLGASGKTGSRVAQRLWDRGLPVRGGSRSGEPPFDWDDSTTWAAALERVSAVYISYYPDLALPGAAERVGEFANQATQCGVRRLVLLSGRGEDGALLGEQAVRDSGAEWTVLRSSWFSQNFSEGFFADQVRSGVVTIPVTSVQEPFVDADDLADLAVAALTGDRHVGQLYELTGPRLMTFAEATDEIARAAGRKILLAQVSPRQYASLLAEQNVPSEFIGLMNYLFAEVLDGRNAHVTDGFERGLARPPRDFSEYARQTAATGIWSGIQERQMHA